MSRTNLLLIACVILGLTAYLALKSDTSEQKLADKAGSRQFAVENVDDVHKIFIADRKGHQVELVRGGPSGWMADGKPANDNIMKNVLQVIKYIDIQTLPTYKAIPTLIKDLANSGILVQVFDKEGTKIRGYYIGGATNEETGTYAIKEGVEDPYIVHIPGFTGNIRQRFMHWGDEWRDKIYFRVDPEKVERFSIEYPKQRNKSFKLEKKESSFELSPFYTTNQQTRLVPAGGVEGVLARYEKYYVNGYENQDTKTIQEMREKLPFAEIRIKETGKEEQVMTIFPRYEEDVYSNDPKTGEVHKAGGLKAYSAFINEGQDWVLLNPGTLQPLLVGYDYF